MRIIGWNIRAGGGRRVERIWRALRSWQPDVVVLTEFRATPPSRWLEARLKAMGLDYQRCTADPSDPARNALLVAARWPLRRLELPDAPHEPGRWISVRIGSTPSLSLGGFHVPNRVTGRKYDFLDAALRCARDWPAGPGLMIGDSNSGIPGIDEQSPAFNRREADWMHGLAHLGWADAYRDLRGKRRAYTWYSPNGDNGFRLDQAFVNRRLRPRLLRAQHRWAGGSRRAGVSDHAALHVDLEL